MKLARFYTLFVLSILSLQSLQAQNPSLCVPAEIQVREGNTTITCEPGAPTTVRFKTSRVNTPYAFAVTLEDGTILRVSTSDRVSFVGLPGGQLRVYAFSYLGLVEAEAGDNIFNADLASICSALSTNFIGILNIVPEGGTVQSGNGLDTEYVCTDDELPDILTFTTSEVEEPIYAYLITDENNQLLGINTDGTVNFTSASPGVCRVWGIAYTGNLIVQNGENILETNLAEGCYDLSDNFVSVIRTTPEGATITVDGSTEDFQACDYPEATNVMITLGNTNDQPFSYAYLLSDEAETTFSVVAGNTINISELPIGNSRVRGISFAGELAADSGAYPNFADINTGCFDLSDNYITLTRTFVDGGQIALEDGSTEARPCGIDELPDSFSFQTTSTAQESYAWILTGDNNLIKGIYTENAVNLDEFADEDHFRVRGLSYRGEILPVIGQALKDATVVDGCYQISENFVTLTRIRPDGGNVSLADGSVEYTGCDSPDLAGQIILDLSNTGNDDFSFVYVLTNTDNTILQVLNEAAIPLSDLPVGNSRIWGLSYEGALIAQIGDNPTVQAPVEGCFDLSDNFVSLERILVEGGAISLLNGETEAITCGIDDLTDSFSFQTTSSSQESYAWILTGNNNRIRGIYTENTIILDEIEGEDNFRVRGLSYRGEILPVIGQRLNNAVPVEGCYQVSENFVTLTRIRPEGGSVALVDGSTDFTGCDSPDLAGQTILDLSNTGDDEFSYVYLLTDTDNNILQVINEEAIPLSDLPKGNSRIWGISYEGVVTAQVGDDPTAVPPVDGCYDISENFIAVERIVVDGGDLSIQGGATEALTCGNDNIPDAFTFSSTSIANDQNYVLIVTNANNRVFSTVEGDIIDFNLFAPRTYRVWGLSYTGTLNIPFNSILTNIAPSDGCYDLSNTFVTIRQEEVDGGQLQFAGGGTEIFTCPGDGSPDVLNYLNDGFTSDSYVYLITTEDNVILETTTDASHDFEGAPAGVCRIWGLAYSGTLNAPVGQKADNLVFSDECYSLSGNFLTVVREVPSGGSIDLVDGGDRVFTCPGDGVADILEFTTTSTYPGAYLFLITNENGRVLDVSATGQYDFDPAEPGTWRVYGVAYTGNWIIEPGDLITQSPVSDDCWSITDNFITVVRETPSAGTVSFADGSKLQYTCPGDGRSDLLEFSNNSSYTGSYIYLITDESNQILMSTTESSFDFDEADLGTCRVWGLAYTGNLTFQAGDNAGAVDLSDDCYALSNNFLSVVRDTPDAGVISTPEGDNLTLCVGDAFADVVKLNVEGASNSQYAYLITDENDVLINVINVPEFDFNAANGGICRIYGLAYTGEIIIVPGDNIFAGPATSDCFSITDNFITLNRINVDGNIISTSDGATDLVYVCSGDGVADPITFENGNDDPQVTYQYLLTTPTNIILGPVNNGTVDVEGSPFDTIRIWGVAYLGNPSLPIGMDVTTAMLSDSCYDVSDNFITIINDLPEGGMASSVDGQDAVRVCIGAGSGVESFTNTSTSLSAYTYLITDLDLEILGVAEDSTFDFNEFEPGNYLVHGLSYTGTLTFAVGDTANLVELASSCYELSANSVAVEVTEPIDGGTITSAFGDPLYVCLDDGTPDIGAFETSSIDPNYRYVITDTLNKIIIPDIEGNVVDFNKANAGYFRVYGVSFTGNFTGNFGTNILEGPLSDLCYAVSSNYISLINDKFDGGTVSTEDGETEIEIMVGNGIPDVIAFDSTGTSGISYTYLITDENNNILSILDGDTQDFDEAPGGICRVWGLAYSGEIIAGIGDNAAEVVLTDGCYVLSENFVTVNRVDTASPYYVPVEFSTASKNMKLQLFPNPVSKSLNVRIRALFEDIDLGKGVTIEVFELSGRRIITLDQDLYDKDSTFELDVQSLPLGMYVLRVINGDERVQQRFFKQ